MAQPDYTNQSHHMVRLKRFLQAISTLSVLSAMSPQTLNPKRLNLAFREWSVSGNCSHPVYVGDFQTSNRNLLLSPLVESAFSGSADHTVIV